MMDLVLASACTTDQGNKRHGEDEGLGASLGLHYRSGDGILVEIERREKGQYCCERAGTGRNKEAMV